MIRRRHESTRVPRPHLSRSIRLPWRKEQVRLLKTQAPRAERARTTSSNTTEFCLTGALYADKDEYIAKNLVFTINAIEFQAEARLVKAQIAGR